MCTATQLHSAAQGLRIQWIVLHRALHSATQALYPASQALYPDAQVLYSVAQASYSAAQALLCSAGIALHVHCILLHGYHIRCTGTTVAQAPCSFTQVLNSVAQAPSLARLAFTALMGPATHGKPFTI